MSSFSKFLGKSEDNSKKSDFVEYHVRPISVLEKEIPCIGLTFPSRDLARQYKKLLKNSLAKLDAKIIRRESMDGYIVSESEIH
jgi:hypothetical protein